jgi:hypothetical protein
MSRFQELGSNSANRIGSSFFSPRTLSTTADHLATLSQGILKEECAIDLLFDQLGLVCFANKNKNCLIADSKPVKQEVISTVILPPLVFPDSA